MNKAETIAALTIIATFFPHSFSLAEKGMIDLWARELADYDPQEVEDAVRILCREKDKFPTLKDVLDRLDPVQAGAAEAWAFATRYVSEWGSGPVVRRGEFIEPPAIEDPATARAVEAVGGIAAIRARTLDDEPAMRAHFFRAYDEAKATRKREQNRAAIAAGRPQNQQVIDVATHRIGRQMLGGGGGDVVG